MLCPGAADVNRDAAVDITDPITILNHLFRSGPLDPGEVYCDRGPQ